MEGGGDAKLAEARTHVRNHFDKKHLLSISHQQLIINLTNPSIIIFIIIFILIITIFIVIIIIIIITVAQQVEEVAGIMRDNMEKVFLLKQLS